MKFGRLCHGEMNRGEVFTNLALTMTSALARSRSVVATRRSTMAGLRAARPSSVRLYSWAMTSSSTPRRERIMATMMPVPGKWEG